MEPPNPKNVAKAPVHGVKGVAAFAKKKPAVTFAVIAGILVMAYMIRKRQNAANADAAVPELDYSGANAPIGSITDPSGGGGGGAYYPDPTQGVGEYLPGGTSSNVPLPPDSWGPPWWWVNPPTGGGLPSGTPGSANTIDNNPPPPPDPPVYQTPANLPAVGSPHVVASKPQATTGSTTPSWAGPGNKYPYKSDRGWYRLVMVAKGVHKGRWHYYGPSDNPKIKVSDNPNG